MVKKSGLGKGLESLMGEANAEVGSVSSDASLPISKIKPNKNQPRQSFEAEPMNFMSQEGEMPPYWTKLFAQLGQLG